MDLLRILESQHFKNPPIDLHSYETAHYYNSTIDHYRLNNLPRLDSLLYLQQFFRLPHSSQGLPTPRPLSKLQPTRVGEYNHSAWDLGVRATILQIRNRE